MSIIVEGLVEAVNLKNYSAILCILGHLKNNVRGRWATSNKIKVHISAADKQELVRSVIKLNDMFAKLEVQEQSYKFLKILKDIMVFMRVDLIRTYQEVVEALRRCQSGP
jgi:hypothetical protein